jgi:predicted component of type VI protein secretion system
MELVWVEQAPRSGYERPVEPGTIGREGCDIVLPDPDVSRRHAVIRTLDSGLAIEDLGSTNGTYVNDQRLKGIAELQQGDRVRFGNTIWELRAPSSATRVAQPQPSPKTVVETPAAPAPSRGEGRRGDVPSPDFAPSAIRRVLPADPGQQPQFAATSHRRVRGSAARRVEATLVSYAVVIATAVAVAAYLSQR